MVELMAKTENPLDLRSILVASDTSPTYEWRIRSGALFATLRKPSKLLFWMRPSKWVKATFSIKMISASGYEFEYNRFVLMLKRDKTADALKMFNEICSSNTGAMKHFEHPNPSIRKLCYIKQSDFRDLPILFILDNGKTDQPIVVNGHNNAITQTSRGVHAPTGELPRPEFLRNR